MSSINIVTAPAVVQQKPRRRMEVQCCSIRAKTTYTGRVHPRLIKRRDGIFSTPTSLSPRRMRQRDGSTAAPAAGGEVGFDVGGIAGGGGDEHVSLADFIGQNALHVQQRFADLGAMNSSDVDVGWGNELHYLMHHPVHFFFITVVLAGVYGIVQRGRYKVKVLKAEFLSKGVDLTNVGSRVDTLTYLKKMQEAGMLALGLEVCAMRQAEMDMLCMGPEGVKKWKAYYAQRGIEVESGKDLDRVRKHIENLQYLEGCLLGIDAKALTN